MGRLKKIKEGKGFSDLLIGQFLIAVLIYIAVAFYDSAPQLTLGIVGLLLIGVLYFSLKGIKQLWFKGPKRQ